MIARLYKGLLTGNWVSRNPTAVATKLAIAAYGQGPERVVGKL